MSINISPIAKLWIVILVNFSVQIVFEFLALQCIRNRIHNIILYIRLYSYTFAVLMSSLKDLPSTLIDGTSYKIKLL